MLSPLLSLTFQVISGTSQIFRLLNPRDKKRYYATQYFNFSVTLLRYGLKILTDSWIEGDLLGYPDHPPRRCHSGRQPTFIHFFTNTLKLAMLLAGSDRVSHLPRSLSCMPSGHIPRQVKSCFINAFSINNLGSQRLLKSAEK